MFRCDNCGNSGKGEKNLLIPGTKPVLRTVTAEAVYPARWSNGAASYPDGSGNGTYGKGDSFDKGGGGTRIVKENKLCPNCAALPS